MFVRIGKLLLGLTLGAVVCWRGYESIGPESQNLLPQVMCMLFALFVGGTAIAISLDREQEQEA